MDLGLEPLGLCGLVLLVQGWWLVVLVVSGFGFLSPKPYAGHFKDPFLHSLRIAVCRVWDLGSLGTL